MTARITAGPVIQDDMAFKLSATDEFALNYMDLKQGRLTRDMHIELCAEDFSKVFSMFCRARYKNIQNPDPSFRFTTLGIPVEMFSITKVDYENETEYTLTVSLVETYIYCDTVNNIESYRIEGCDAAGLFIPKK